MQIRSNKILGLKLISNKINKKFILPLCVISFDEWKKSGFNVNNIKKIKFFLKDRPLIVRSASIDEDTDNYSNAGKYLSILNINSISNLNRSIGLVFSSYNRKDLKNEIFIQPMMKDIKISGVIFTDDPNSNGNYYVINYEKGKYSSDKITSGTSKKSFVYFISKTETEHIKIKWIQNLLSVVDKVVDINSNQSLDIEFGINSKNEVIIFQSRKLIIKNVNRISIEKQRISLNLLKLQLQKSLSNYPPLHGKKNIYGIMPDWNPAEIIGKRPNPLALSLYKELITNKIWAYQRDNYGYKNLRSFPILKDFYGLPYIDVRVSFNSFLPKQINTKISEKLINYYIDKLSNNISLHDKVEFEIIFSCNSLTLNKDLKILKKHNFNNTEILQIKNSLVDLTNNIVNMNNGYWLNDQKKLKILESKYNQVVNGNYSIIDKIYWLIEDCKRYGTLPFAGLARSAFIAVKILHSMKEAKLIDSINYNNFLLSIKTVSKQMQLDLKNMNKKQFIKEYGHLRPGTYNILSDKYDNGKYYIDFDSINKINFSKQNNFKISKINYKKIDLKLVKSGFNISSKNLFKFIKISIESREKAKFLFSKNISKILELLIIYGKFNNISRKDMSYFNIHEIKYLYSGLNINLDKIKKNIKTNKKNFQLTESINLPPIIRSIKDINAFLLDQNEPNYITNLKVIGKVSKIHSNNINISNKIIFIENADPGYDWIFSHNIKGLITMYGGLNSHMAIRAVELNIPAIIGAGHVLYNKWFEYDFLEINCFARTVNKISTY